MSPIQDGLQKRLNFGFNIFRMKNKKRVLSELVNVLTSKKIKTCRSNFFLYVNKTGAYYHEGDR